MSKEKDSTFIESIKEGKAPKLPEDRLREWLEDGFFISLVDLKARAKALAYFTDLDSYKRLNWISKMIEQGLPYLSYYMQADAFLAELRGYEIVEAIKSTTQTVQDVYNHYLIQFRDKRKEGKNK